MNIDRARRTIRSYIPSKKWCGCSKDAEDKHLYQFRVKARFESNETNLFQVREKTLCERCRTEDIDVKIEANCNFDPYNDIHHRQVMAEETEMMKQGFLDQEEIIRMLIEMRLSDSLTPHLNDEE